MSSDISEELRAEVARRAGHRCEYCLIHEDEAGFSHQVDHIVSRKHGGASTLDNLAYACVVCNRHKGSDVASIDPRTAETLIPAVTAGRIISVLNGALIEPISSIGWATTRLLRLNGPERISERRLLQSLGSYRRW